MARNSSQRSNSDRIETKSAVGTKFVAAQASDGEKLECGRPKRVLAAPSVKDHTMKVEPDSLNQPNIVQCSIKRVALVKPEIKTEQTIVDGVVYDAVVVPSLQVELKPESDSNTGTASSEAQENLDSLNLFEEGNDSDISSGLNDSQYESEDCQEAGASNKRPEHLIQNPTHEELLFVQNQLQQLDNSNINPDLPAVMELQDFLKTNSKNLSYIRENIHCLRKILNALKLEKKQNSFGPNKSKPDEFPVEESEYGDPLLDIIMNMQKLSRLASVATIRVSVDAKQKKVTVKNRDTESNPDLAKKAEYSYGGNKENSAQKYKLLTSTRKRHADDDDFFSDQMKKRNCQQNMGDLSHQRTNPAESNSTNATAFMIEIKELEGKRKLIEKMRRNFNIDSHTVNTAGQLIVDEVDLSDLFESGGSNSEKNSTGANLPEQNSGNVTDKTTLAEIYLKHRKSFSTALIDKTINKIKKDLFEPKDSTLDFTFEDILHDPKDSIPQMLSMARCRTRNMFSVTRESIKLQKELAPDENLSKNNDATDNETCTISASVASIASRNATVATIVPEQIDQPYPVLNLPAARVLHKQIKTATDLRRDFHTSFVHHDMKTSKNRDGHHSSDDEVPTRKGFSEPKKDLQLIEDPQTMKSKMLRQVRVGQTVSAPSTPGAAASATLVPTPTHDNNISAVALDESSNDVPASNLATTNGKSRRTRAFDGPAAGFASVVVAGIGRYSKRRNNKHAPKLMDESIPYKKCVILSESMVMPASLKKTPPMPCFVTFFANSTFYCCTQCIYQTNNRFRYRTHYYGHNYTRYTCKFCEFTASNEEKLLVHELRHTVETNIMCPLCSYMSQDKKGLARHLMMHTSFRATKTSCSNCDYAADDFSSVRKHCIEVHGIHQNKTKLECVVCNVAMNDFTFFNNHMRDHTVDGMYVCLTCGYTSAIANEIQDHISLKHVDNIIKCEHCDFTTKYRCNMTKHSNCHKIGMNFLCSVCNFKAGTKTTLNKHILTHGKSDFNKINLLS